MNILYCGDSNIADGVIISSVSLTKMIKAPIHFYILTAEVEHNGIFRPALQSDFCSFLQKELQKYNAENTVRLIDITEKFKNQKPNANMDTRFTPCCMLRLYADEVDELPSKILYLDNDVICREDPTQFYNQDMSDSPIAGVNTTSIWNRLKISNSVCPKKLKYFKTPNIPRLTAIPNKRTCLFLYRRFLASASVVRDTFSSHKPM